MSELPDGPAKAILAVTLIVVIGGSLLNGFGATAVLNQDDSRIDVNASSVQTRENIDQLTLRDSAGYGTAFGSSMGSINIPTDGGVGDRNTTVSVWAELNDSALLSGHYHVANFGNGVVSMQYRDGSWYGLYNATDGTSAVVTAPAPTPRSLTMVGVRANGTHLSIVRNGTVRNATAFASGNEPVPAARSWWGRQDEIRVWDAPLNATQLEDLYTDPIAPVDHSDLSMRLMLDEGSGSSTYVLVVGSDAQLTGDVGWTSGLSGSAFERGTDYLYNDSTGEITVIDGSELDRYYVAYLSYRIERSGSLGGLFAPAFYIALAMFVMVSVALLKLAGDLA